MRLPRWMAAPFLGVLALAAARPAAAETIKEIEVQDNSKTTDDTVMLIARLDIGDDWNDDMIPKVREDLVSSGLFKEVEVMSTPMAGGVRVIIVAKDKHSWMIAPTYYNQPTNKGGGVGFGENNLFGTNKKLLLYGQIATGDSFFIGAFVDPSIAGTRLRSQLDVYLQSARIFEYSPPDGYIDDTRPVRKARLNYLNLGGKLGVGLFRGASIDARLRGAYVSYDDVALTDGTPITEVTDEPGATMAPDPGKEGYDISASGSLTYDTRADWYGITHGDKYKVTFERSLPDIGSDFDYWNFTFNAERARRYFETHNLDMRALIGWGNELPFQQEYTSGGTALRGYRNAEFRGDLKAAINVEYSVQMFNIHGFALRALGFVDAAYTTFRDSADGGGSPDRNYLPSSDVRGLAPLKTSIGLGTRVHLRQVALPLLGLDVGYGPERRAFEVYFAIGLTDF
jgi:outer membrane protein assembly factor BamA